MITVKALILDKGKNGTPCVSICTKLQKVILPVDVAAQVRG